MSEIFWAISVIAVLTGYVLDWHLRKKYKSDLAKEITRGLVRNVVIIEGRCPKCDERIPDELLTKEDLKKQGSVMQ